MYIENNNKCLNITKMERVDLRSPLRGHRLIEALSVQARGFACFNEVGGYADGSIATGRVSLVGQVPTEKSDEVCPTTTYHLFLSSFSFYIPKGWSE